MICIFIQIIYFNNIKQHYMLFTNFFGLILDCHHKWMAVAHRGRQTRAGNELIHVGTFFGPVSAWLVNSQEGCSVYIYIYAYSKPRPNDINQSILDLKKPLDANQTRLAQSLLMEMVSSSQRKSLQTCVRASAKIDHGEKTSFAIAWGFKWK